MPLRMTWMKCSKCNHEFEELLKLPDEVNSICPECGEIADILQDFQKQVHRNGNKYRHVSWSTWNIGSN